MAIYKRYNTRRKRVPWTAVACVIAIAVAFILTAMLGHHLGEKARGGEALYTGSGETNIGTSNLTPLSEKSLHGYYTEPKNIAKFTSESEDIWASTWIYKDGNATFATATDEKLGKTAAKPPKLDSFDIDANTIGLFEVSAIYADEQVKSVVSEYELALLEEFAASGLDETVLVFREVDGENYDEVFEFAEKFSGAKVICVPYSMLGNDAFFSEAASRQFSLALKAQGLKPQKLREDIDKFAFYFTRYNLRLVLDGKDSALVDVLSENTLLNYQFCSPAEDE